MSADLGPLTSRAESSLKGSDCILVAYLRSSVHCILSWWLIRAHSRFMIETMNCVTHQNRWRWKATRLAQLSKKARGAPPPWNTCRAKRAAFLFTEPVSVIHDHPTVSAFP